ncbi:MAG: DUF4258 domain-containing protein [Maribacter sp.]|nr:DUF4258 domain-containing protein [Maribacter sp.]NNK75190.1 DUF4258 domain-containing protein [Maribacter sp.]
MAFLKRLGFYLFGLAIGLIFLAIFFKNKTEGTGVEFCYFPNCRTLKDIRSKPLSYTDDVKLLLKRSQLDSVKIAYFLTEGSVDFKKSDTKSTPCKSYVINAELDEKPAVMLIQNCPDKALIESVAFDQ